MYFQVGLKKHPNFVQKIHGYIPQADFWTGFSGLSCFHRPKEGYFVDREPDSHLGCQWPRWTLVILVQFGEEPYWNGAKLYTHIHYSEKPALVTTRIVLHKHSVSITQKSLRLEEHGDWRVPKGCMVTLAIFSNLSNIDAEAYQNTDIVRMSTQNSQMLHLF